MIGQKTRTFWGSTWYESEVLEVLPNGSVKVHYVGFASSFDEVKSPDLIAVSTAPATLAAPPKPADSTKTAADPAPSSAPSPSAESPSEDPADEPLFAVKVERLGSKALFIVRIVAEHTQQDEAAVRQMLLKAPVVVFEGSKSQAEALKTALEEKGARVSIKEIRSKASRSPARRTE